MGSPAAGHGIREGAVRKSRFCWVFHFGPGLFNRCRSHQVQSVHSPGAHERWGSCVSSALHSASRLLDSNQSEVGHVGFFLQALEFLGDHGGQQAIQGVAQLQSLSLGQALH